MSRFGSLPTGWSRCRLGDQITLQRGVDITKAQCREGSVPVISSGGISAYHDTAIAAGPGVLLGRKGSVGSVHFSDVAYWPHDTNLWVKDFRGNYPRFVFHFFKQFPIARYEASTSNPTLNRNNLHPVEVLWPSLPDQHRIADILDKADAIRRKRKEAMALTEELLRSAFLEMFGDPVTNPKGWPVKALGELLDTPLRNGLSPASGGTFEARVLTLSAITRGRFDASAWKPGAFAVEPWDDVRVDSRDFLICRGNGNVSLVGSAAFPSESIKSIVFPDTMIAARVDHSRVLPAFLDVIWKSAFIRRQIEAGARTTNGTFKINQNVVEGIHIVLPPRAKQQAFAEAASRVSRIVTQQRNELGKSECLLNSLVARAFSGELTS